MASELEIVIKGTDKASSVFRDIAKESSGLGNILGGIVKTGALAAAAGIGILGAGIAKSIAEASEAEKGQAQLAAVLKSTKGAAGITAEAANQLADSLSRVTTFEDDAIIGGENMLLTFTNIGKDVFPDATETMLDMSQALGQDLKSSAIQLGKALNDPIQGVSALQRVGVSFTDSQKEQIKTLVESGKTMDAQKLILKELQTEFGGAARAAGETFSGQLAILNNQVGNIWEEIGTAFLPALKDLTQWVNQNVVPAFKVFAEDVMPKIRQVLSDVGASFHDLFAELAEGKIADAFSDFTAGLLITAGVSEDKAFAIGGAIGDMAQTISDAWNNEIKPALDALKAWLETDGVVALQTFIDEMGKFKPQADEWMQILRDMKSVFGETTTAINDDASIKFPSLAEIISMAMGHLRDIVQANLDVIRDLQRAASALMQGDWMALGQALGSITDDFMNILTVSVFGVNFKKLKADTQAFAFELGAALSADLLSFVDALREDARNMMRGVVLGFWDEADSIRQSLDDIISGAIDNIRNTLGIHSPSTIFADMGANMAAGLMQGFAHPQLNFAPVIAGAAQSGQMKFDSASTLGGGGNTTAIQGGITIIFQLDHAPSNEAEGNNAARMLVNGLRAQGVPI